MIQKLMNKIIVVEGSDQIDKLLDALGYLTDQKKLKYIEGRVRSSRYHEVLPFFVFVCQIFGKKLVQLYLKWKL